MANLIRALCVHLFLLLLVPATASAQQSSKNIPARDAVSSQRPAAERQQAKKGSVTRAQADATQTGAEGARERTILDLPGYPKYIITDNPELDEKNYQLAKVKWMEENPELYRNYLREASAGFDRSSLPPRQPRSNR